MRWGRFLAGLFLLALLAAGGSYAFLLQLLEAPGPLTAEKIVYIEQGSATRTIARQLQEETVIDSPLVFLLGAKLRQADGGLKAGEYLLAAGLTPAGIIRLLQAGKTYQRPLTVAEGLTSVEIIAALNDEEALAGAVEAIPPDGTLLPETYHYSRGDKRQDLIDRMQQAMRTALAELWEKRVPGLPVFTPEEAVTLASIVEKETGVAAERPRIAGVFVNRLKAGMALQSDPTVIYALTQGRTKLERPLTRKDLEISSPYNTYAMRGLPPGPIANPGRAALAAVLMPESHDLFYFVADGTGGHAFGKTLEDHIKNVAEWRKLQKNSK